MRAMPCRAGGGSVLAGARDHGGGGRRRILVPSCAAYRRDRRLRALATHRVDQRLRRLVVAIDDLPERIEDLSALVDQPLEVERLGVDGRLPALLLFLASIADVGPPRRILLPFAARGIAF